MKQIWVFRFSQQPMNCEVIIWKYVYLLSDGTCTYYLKVRVPIIWRYVYLQLLFIQIFSTLNFIIVVVRIISVFVINFYIYVIKDFKIYLSSVLPIYRSLNATAISIFEVRELSYLGRICETCLEALR
jgi:hypothetical protein